MANIDVPPQVSEREAELRKLILEELRRAANGAVDEAKLAKFAELVRPTEVNLPCTHCSAEVTCPILSTKVFDESIGFDVSLETIGTQIDETVSVMNVVHFLRVSEKPARRRSGFREGSTHHETETCSKNTFVLEKNGFVFRREEFPSISAIPPDNMKDRAKTPLNIECDTCHAKETVRLQDLFYDAEFFPPTDLDPAKLDEFEGPFVIVKHIQCGNVERYQLKFDGESLVPELVRAIDPPDEVVEEVVEAAAAAVQEQQNVDAEAVPPEGAEPPNPNDVITVEEPEVEEPVLQLIELHPTAAPSAEEQPPAAPELSPAVAPVAPPSAPATVAPLRPPAAGAEESRRRPPPPVVEKGTAAFEQAPCWLKRPSVWAGISAAVVLAVLAVLAGLRKSEEEPTEKPSPIPADVTKKVHNQKELDDAAQLPGSIFCKILPDPSAKENYRPECLGEHGTDFKLSVMAPGRGNVPKAELTASVQGPCPNDPAATCIGKIELPDGGFLNLRQINLEPVATE